MSTRNGTHRAPAAVAVAWLALSCARAPATQPSPIASSAPSAPVASTTAAPPPSAPPSTCEPLRDVADVVAVDGPLPLIIDATESMARFHDKLARLARGRATDHVRVAMYGDSNMTMDYLSGEIRRVFQKRFGDGGHGFVTATRHLFYRHMDVDHGASEGWSTFTISNNPVGDRLYGFGLVAAQSRGRGATSWLGTADDKSPIGKTASRFDLFFLRRPGGGAFDVKIDGDRKATIDTNAAETAAGYERIEVPDGAHKMIVETLDGKPVRLFGAAIERSAPSVIVDSIGVTSLNIGQLASENDEAMLEATLAKRAYDLVIVMTGTNEWYPESKHLELARAVVEHHRRATPGVSVLFMSPPDKAMGGEHRSAWPITEMAKAKFKAAAATGAAFWDFRMAMGGDGAIFDFMKRGLAGSDQRHLTERGGFYMGDRVALALWRDFVAFVAKHPNAGCP